MDSAVLIAVIVTLGGGITGLISYRIARRRSSGQIVTSDAETLWKESQEMRRELRDQVLALRGEVAELRTEIRSMRVVIEQLRSRLATYENPEALT